MPIGSDPPVVGVVVVVVVVVVSPPDVPVLPPLGDGDGVGPGVGEGVRDGQNWGDMNSSDCVTVPWPTVSPSLIRVYDAGRSTVTLMALAGGAYTDFPPMFATTPVLH